MALFAIYARAANGAIGKDGGLPWRLPADLRHFKAKTMGADGNGLPMIMGRKTFESFPAPLSGRRHIVLTRRERWDSTGAEVVRSVDEALAKAGGDAAVIGGAAIFDVFLPHCDRVELTEIHAEFAGDVFMPPLGSDWREVAREEHAETGNNPSFAFVTLEKAR